MQNPLQPNVKQGRAAQVRVGLYGVAPGIETLGEVFAW
jgi:hypothetical protein